jgi:L-fucose isomerase-like protein
MAPYDVEQARAVCRALALRREMQTGVFVSYQDDPGEGFQADIFKRFFWWEDTCVDLIKRKFGITVVRRSLRELGERARGLPEGEAEELNARLACPREGVSDEMMLRAARLMLAVSKDIEGEPHVLGVGTNCLNESHFCDTTPCVAWNALYEEHGILWACEADVLSLLSMVIMHRPLDASLLMTNLYPFLMGLAALRHEHIDAFPDVDDPDDHALLAHCGYLGIVPRPHATEWAVRPKVLDIVDDEAIALDARLPLGPVTFYKLNSRLDRMMVIEGELESYVQYPESHCKNGAVVRVPDGHAVMKRLYSHHQCVAVGHLAHAMEWVANVFGLEIEAIR